MNATPVVHTEKKGENAVLIWLDYLNHIYFLFFYLLRNWVQQIRSLFCWQNYYFAPLKQYLYLEYLYAGGNQIWYFIYKFLGSSMILYISCLVACVNANDDLKFAGKFQGFQILHQYWWWAWEHSQVTIHTMSPYPE